MKKLLSVLLVVVSILSMTSAAFAVSGDVTVTFTNDPTIVMSLSTNNVNFNNVNPQTGSYTASNALGITVSSNTTWNLTAQASSDLVDGAKTIPISQLKWKEVSGGSWTSFSTTAGAVLSSQPATTSTTKNFDFKLDLTYADQPGTYSTTISYVATTI